MKESADRKVLLAFSVGCRIELNCDRCMKNNKIVIYIELMGSTGFV